MTKQRYWRVLAKMTADYREKHPSVSEVEAHDAVVSDAFAAYERGSDATVQIPARSPTFAADLYAYRKKQAK